MTETYYSGKKHKLPKVLNKKQLLVAMREIRSPTVMMGIFLSTFLGLRVGEIAIDDRRTIIPLKWENVDLEIGEVLILDAKNPKRFKSGYGKDRIVPIFDEFLHIFKMWRSLNQDSEYVLPHQNYKGKPMRVPTLQRHLQEALEKIGLMHVEYYQNDGKPRYMYHYHTLRHVCACNLLRRGLTLEQVKEFLGHESIETTQVYIKLVKDDLKEAVTHAFAYPKKRQYFLDLKQPNFDLQVGLEALRLENENLKLKLQLQQEMVVIR
ncbi:MAG TPA: site-specific integrase [Candidatus Nanoarchaeia archaeon]|nr:site-specific integrase [Candidatus Nanoarchaeia archaeon]